MTIVVGLTGSLSTGKSTVASMLEEKGAKRLDADAIVHRIMRPRGACFEAVVDAFGEDILNRGAIDRRKLGTLVFKDFKKLDKLVGIIHPVVKKELREKVQGYKKRFKRAVIVIDVPLLFESGLYRDVDVTLVVKTTRTVQLARATGNFGLTTAEARRRIQAQWPLTKKIRMADIIIDNSGTREQTKKEVERIWQKLRQMTKR